MRARTIKWALALTVSGILHAGAAVLLMPGPEDASIAGGAPMEVALAGNSAADQVAIGAALDAVEPLQHQTNETKPVETRMAAVEPAPPTRPDEPRQTVAPDLAPRKSEKAQSSEPVRSAAVAPVETPTASTAQAVAPEVAVPSENAEIPAASEAEPVERQAVEPVEAARAEAPSETAASEPDAVKPATPEETLQALADVPIPTPRPDYTPPKPEKRVVREARREPPRTSGSKGRNREDSRRGVANGQKKGNADRQGSRTARANAAGNAAVSNYPGKVVRELRRALRYPSDAGRQQGEVQVRFTVSRNGGVGGIRVVRSSGSKALDRAAVATVQRAAPFPAIPAAAGRSSWPFTVPLAFVR